MTFIQLLKALERELGYHQFPVDACAPDLARVFESSAVHHDLATRLVREIYRANRCQKLSHPVSRELTLSALIPIRLDILKADNTDIDLFRFIENCCEVIERSLALPVDPPAPVGAAIANSSADVLPFIRPGRLPKDSFG